MSRRLHLSKKEIEFQANTIFGIAANCESGTIVCYPGCKIDYNLNCFLNSTSLQKQSLGNNYKDYLFVKVIVDANTSYRQIVTHLSASVQAAGIALTNDATLPEIATKVASASKTLYVFLVCIEPTNAATLTELLRHLHSVITASRHIRSLLFIERNIHESDVAQLLATHHSFLQNIRTFPIYSYTESRYFLRQFAEDSGVYLPEQLIEEIADVCGGILWLLRGFMRRLLDEKSTQVTTDQIYNSPLVQLRATSIIKQLTPKEVLVLQAIVSNQPNHAPRLELQHLITLGLVANNQKNYSVSSLLIAEKISHSQQSLKLHINADNQIVYESRNITAELSLQQKQLLTEFIKHKGKIISRADIANALWDNPNDYSDWAIDQTMSRLRKILHSQGLPRDLIKTKKGQGFLLR